MPLMRVHGEQDFWEILFLVEYRHSKPLARVSVLSILLSKIIWVTLDNQLIPPNGKTLMNMSLQSLL